MSFNTFPQNPFPPNSENIGGGGSPYVLPIASANELGGVKVGENLTIDSNGVLTTIEKYSITPVTVGKWIDNKDLKKVVLPFDATSGSASIDVTSLNIDKAFCVGCFCQEEVYETNNLAITPLYNSTEDKFSFQLNGARTAINVSVGNEKRGHGAIILCYTERESEVNKNGI